VSVVKPESRQDAGPRHVVPEAAPDDLPGLIARLGDEIATLVDGKLRLLKLDLEEEVRAYARGVMIAALGAVAVAVGVTLAAVSLAFGIAHLLPASLDPLLVRALAFAVVAVLGVASGALVLRHYGARLATPGADDA
jgi:hypothetical protein